MNVRNKNKKVVDCVKTFATHCNFLFLILKEYKLFNTFPYLSNKLVDPVSLFPPPL